MWYPGWCWARLGYTSMQPNGDEPAPPCPSLDLATPWPRGYRRRLRRTACWAPSPAASPPRLGESQRPSSWDFWWPFSSSQSPSGKAPVPRESVLCGAVFRGYLQRTAGGPGLRLSFSHRWAYIVTRCFKIATTLSICSTLASSYGPWKLPAPVPRLGQGRPM